MLDIGGRVIFLTGAPLPSSLGWTEEELCAPLQPGFIERLPGGLLEISTIDDKAPSWRCLPVEKPHLPTGLTQISQEHQQFDDYGYSNDETSFLSAAELSFSSNDPNEYPSEHSQFSDSDKEDVSTQYYEHSFALHENIPSSQIVGAESLDDSFTTDPEDFSIALSTSSQSHHPESHQLTRSKLTSSHLTDLKDLPNATYLRSITPQTMTVNLVAGIISIPQPRTIKTRRGGHSIDLVEILVGDDTKSGFGINIWLPPSSPSAQHQDNNDLRNQTSHLRPQDVILAKTVALSSFRGKVYGQSLRRGMTTLDLLYRNVLDGDDVCGAFGAAELEQATTTTTTINEPQIRKLRDVKEWVMRFVGGASLMGPRPPLTNGIPIKSRVADETKLQALPNDTPQR